MLLLLFLEMLLLSVNITALADSYSSSSTPSALPETQTAPGCSRLVLLLLLLFMVLLIFFPLLFLLLLLLLFLLVLLLLLALLTLLLLPNNSFGVCYLS